jgi:hypothetical protein
MHCVLLPPPLLLLVLLLLLLLLLSPPPPPQLYIGNLAAGQVTEGMLQQVFNSALIAAFPDAGRPGQEPVIKVGKTLCGVCNLHTGLQSQAC